MPTIELLIYWLIFSNLIAFVLMVWDKHCAEIGSWRVSEGTLILWSMLGGSIGALSASRIIRHKTKKQPIADMLLIIPLVHFALIAVWLFASAA